MRNVEIKARVRNLQQLIEKAKQLSNTEGQIIKQHDTFYHAANGRLKLREFEDGSSELIFYDRPDADGPKLSDYEKATIAKDQTKNLNSVLTRALGAKSVVKKVRQLYLVNQTRVHVDSVEGLGDFMELEVVLEKEQSLEDGERIAKDLMVKLGVDKSDLLSGAYADLLVKNN